MKYYIGQLVIIDRGSDREYNRHVCVAAANEEAARRELEGLASDWDSDPQKDFTGGWRYGEAGATYVVMPYSLHEISAATFDEVSKVLTPLGDVAKVSLDDKAPAEAVKAVCHRLNEQLAKAGVKVPQAKLLRALSGALGATGWDQLKAKTGGTAAPRPAPETTAPVCIGTVHLSGVDSGSGELYDDFEFHPDNKVLQALQHQMVGWNNQDGVTLEVFASAAKGNGKRAADSTLPRGNPKQEPLRRAQDIDFAARVDALWLTDGDVAMAAKLLHVDGEDLMSTFRDAGEADVAFCSRPANWKPEHSLARDYGVLADAKFEVLVQNLYPGHTQVHGWVDGQEAIGFNDHIGGNWHMTGMTVPRGTLDEVRNQLACYYETLRRAVELRRAGAAPAQV